MKLVYDIKDKPKVGQILIFAFQQLLAILAATIAVPMIIGNGMSPAAALFGAGVGTLIYVLFTKGRSPVFLGSSFAFLGSLAAAFAGAVSVEAGFAGLIIGACIAGLVYVVLAIIVKVAGVKWINKLMPAQVIGPTVAIIGLSLAGNAAGDLQTASAGGHTLVAVLCGLVTLLVVTVCSVYGTRSMKLIPFIIGILAGYALAAILTVIGTAADIPELLICDFSRFETMSAVEVPEFTFLTALKGIKDVDAAYILKLIVAYLPVSFVIFAEHLADHKNISSIIERDLLEDPGLHRTLAGDGVGSFVGAIFGGCPNTTSGESIACVAITGNAAVITIIATACLAMVISFVGPFVTFLSSIPTCVMGGVCMSLYGFIAVSGLKMVQKVNLEDNKNLFVVSVILIAGIGGLSLTFGQVTITTIATALILGIIFNLVLSGKKSEEKKEN